MRPLVPGDAETLLGSWRSARERRDVEAMLALYAETAEYRPDPFAPPLNEALAIRAYWNESALTQLHVAWDAERSWVSGQTILASWHGAHSMRATGARIRQRGFSVFEVDDEGLILRQRDWTLAREVGEDSTFRPEPVTDEPARD